jgi:hypothetical protein
VVWQDPDGGTKWVNVRREDDIEDPGLMARELAEPLRVLAFDEKEISGCEVVTNDGGLEIVV